MNSRELAFCAHYHVNHDAKAAAEAAGFNNAGSNGSRILKRGHIQDQLNFLANHAATIVALDAGVVVNELGAVALTRPDELMKIDDGRWIGKRPEELNEQQRASVRTIRVRDVYIDEERLNAEGEVLGTHQVYSHQEFHYTQYDKLNALFKLGDHFGVGDTPPGGAGDSPFKRMPQARLEKLTKAYQAAMDSEEEAIEGETADV